MTTLAWVVHQTAERLRLRIPDRRYDEPWFADLGHRLAGLPGVRAVRVNAQTAGVLLRLDPATGRDQLAHIVSAGLLRIAGEGPVLSPSLAGLRRAVDRLDHALARVTGGHGDVRTLTFILLLILALTQAARGQVLAPATSLLWYAYDLVRFAHPADRT